MTEELTERHLVVPAADQEQKGLAGHLRDNLPAMIVAAAISLGGWVSMASTTIAVQNQRIDGLNEKLRGTASSSELQQLREEQRQVLIRLDSLHTDVQDVYKILVERK